MYILWLFWDKSNKKILFRDFLRLRQEVQELLRKKRLSDIKEPALQTGRALCLYAEISQNIADVSSVPVHFCRTNASTAPFSLPIFAAISSAGAGWFARSQSAMSPTAPDRM